jgi:hypothetical protein
MPKVELHPVGSIKNHTGFNRIDEKSRQCCGGR